MSLGKGPDEDERRQRLRYGSVAFAIDLQHQPLVSSSGVKALGINIEALLRPLRFSTKELLTTIKSFLGRDSSTLVGAIYYNRLSNIDRGLKHAIRRSSTSLARRDKALVFVLPAANQKI